MRPQPSSTRLQAVAAWGRVAAIVAARGYRAVLLTLVAVAVLPTVVGLGAFVVRSGSMEPSIAVGDVAVTKQIDDDGKLPVGRVFVFDNPSRDGELLIHRVVEKQDDGRYVTAGDANSLTDSTPLPRDAFTRQAVLLVPFVGKPIAWLQSGAWLPLVAVTLLSTGIFLLASRELEHESVEVDAAENPARGRRRRRLVRLPVGRVAGTAYIRVPHGAVAVMVLALAIGASLVTAVPTSAAFTSRTRSGSNAWTVKPNLQQPYIGAVMADNPLFLWRLDEASGTVASDYTDNRPGTMTGMSGYSRADGLPNNAGTAVQVGGSTSRIVEAGSSRSAPKTFAAELWFKTTGSGRLIGFGDGQGLMSIYSDRITFVDSYGKVVYGAWTDNPDPSTYLRSTKSYNDNLWHHLVISVNTGGLGISTARMYVDGVKVDEGLATPPLTYSGWWRVGYGQLPTGSIYPPSASLNATIDNVAVYDHELSATRVSAHWNSR